MKEISDLAVLLVSNSVKITYIYYKKLIFQTLKTK